MKYPRVLGIWRRPIFGGASERVVTVYIGQQGIDLDGRWAVITDSGMLVTRQHPETAHSVRVSGISDIRLTSKHEGVFASAPGMPKLFIPYPANPLDPRDPLDNEWHGKGVEVSRQCSVWFTEYLSKERPDRYRLVELNHDEKLSFGGNEHLFVISEESFRKSAQSRADAEDMASCVVFGGVSDEQLSRTNLALLGGILLQGQGSHGAGKLFSLRCRSKIVHEGACVEVLS